MYAQYSRDSFNRDIFMTYKKPLSYIITYNIIIIIYCVNRAYSTNSYLRNTIDYKYYVYGNTR